MNQNNWNAAFFILLWRDYIACDGVWVSLQDFCAVVIFLLCSRCIFLKIILLFAPNKLPVNDWMSQETSAMPLLLNAIKIHACNNASSWMCYDFVLPFATKTPLTNNHWSYLSVDTLSNTNRPFWIIIINCAVAFILLT